MKGKDIATLGMLAGIGYVLYLVVNKLGDGFDDLRKLPTKLYEYVTRDGPVKITAAVKMPDGRMLEIGKLNVAWEANNRGVFFESGKKYVLLPRDPKTNLYGAERVYPKTIT